MADHLYSSNILIIDDEESIRQTFAIFLKAEGYQFVKTVSTFEAAMETLQQSDYDLIISDIVLPGRSGTDLLQEIRKSGTKCPVVMITGFPNLDSASKSIRYGAYDYISKPVNKETLLHFTRHALDHWYIIKRTQLLQQENEKYRRYLDTIFRSVSDAIITVDPQMKVVQLNEKAKQWLYYIDFNKHQNLLQWPVDTMCHAFIDDVRKILQGGQEVRKHIIECATPDQKTKMLSINASPLRDENNELQGVVIVARDLETAKTSEKNQSRTSFHGFVDSSPAMQKVYSLIENIGKVDTSVLVTGESGTGKELVAAALFLKIYWKANSLVIAKAPLPVLNETGQEDCSRLMAAPCFWMRLGKSHPGHSCSCYASFRKRLLPHWAWTSPYRSMFESLLPPTSILKKWYNQGNSGRIYTIA
jgi:two-component system, NtrC family, response regulator HydG